MPYKATYPGYDRKPPIDDAAKVIARLESLRRGERYTYHIGDIVFDGEQYPEVLRIVQCAESLRKAGQISLVSKPVLSSLEGRRVLHPRPLVSERGRKRQQPVDLEHVAIGV